jgi:prophage regulatory protein
MNEPDRQSGGWATTPLKFHNEHQSMSKNNQHYLATAQDRLIRKPEVLARTGLGNTTLYALVKQGSFPASFTLAGRAVAWREADVNRWISDRVIASRSPRA